MRYLMVIAASLVFCVNLAVAGQDAHRGFPTLSSLGVNITDLMTPEVHEGMVMEVRGAGSFILREKLYIICQESDVNGTPATQAKFSLKKGDTVKATVYRLPNKTYFVSEMEIK